jgi:TetR/AcrR family transcriptional repressor of nem operon
MVGRPRQFDVDEALDAAMEAFWAKGYEATSLMDLVSATGLHKGSLYKAFGDKHSLFIQALKRYLLSMRRAKDERLAEAESPLDGVRGVMHAMVDFLDDSPRPMGCMAINSLIELAPHDDEVKKIMVDHLARMRASLGGAVKQAQASGQMSKSRPPELVTAMLMTMLAGVGTTIKTGIHKTDAHTLVDAQIDALT